MKSMKFSVSDVRNIRIELAKASRELQQHQEDTCLDSIGKYLEKV
ncbi:MAG: hypothetical protein ABII22_00340 [Candidatus Micrarchaeota archaeon]